MKPIARTRRFALLAALLGAVVLAGCGGGGSNATSTSASAPAPAGAGNAVKIAGFAFAPANIQVKAGEKITWTNEDSAAHTVTATSGSNFDSGTLAQGASFTFTATKPGTISYMCSIHPSMKGTVTVK